mmetsp:Transcript_7678/g.22686  ORF Transcript_7678/g.22686 Transcript_7678/m.22686 type:complete len:206 (-) Transcript_7678:908-1525(-)
MSQSSLVPVRKAVSHQDSGESDGHALQDPRRKNFMPSTSLGRASACSRRAARSSVPRRCPGLRHRRPGLPERTFTSGGPASMREACRQIDRCRRQPHDVGRRFHHLLHRQEVAPHSQVLPHRIDREVLGVRRRERGAAVQHHQQRSKAHGLQGGEQRRSLLRAVRGLLPRMHGPDLSRLPHLVHQVHHVGAQIQLIHLSLEDRQH